MTPGEIRLFKNVSTRTATSSPSCSPSPFLRQGSPGIIYPSVRRKGGICLACFRPALVSNVRKTARYRFTWTGAPTPAINPEETYM